MTYEASALRESQVAEMHKERHFPIDLAREIPRVKMRRNWKDCWTRVQSRADISATMYMTDRYRTDTSLMRIVQAGEWNAVWGSPRGTCNVNSTSEHDMPVFDIFHDLYLYSETMGHECMKQTSFVGKCTVFIITINWKHYLIYLML